MLIVMKANATAREIDAVVEVVQAIGFRAHPLPGPTRTAIGITGNEGVIDSRRFDDLPGVAEVIRVTKPYKLITLDLRPEKTIVQVGDAAIGDGELAIIAGPCAIEDREQAFAVAEAVKQSGARFFRGGVWKPRTSPYTFQGLGEKAWESARSKDRHRGSRRVQYRSDRAARRCHPDWRSQHAELFAFEEGGPVEVARAVEARNGGNTRGMVARGRVHYGRGQLQCYPVRARCSHFRAAHA